jgi:hypothetical protein
MKVLGNLLAEPLACEVMFVSRSIDIIAAIPRLQLLSFFA